MDGDLRQARQFQCSSASRKFLNPVTPRPRRRTLTVSVLFSEPKIPQFLGVVEVARADDCFSALQRAENSSINAGFWFADAYIRFSALQRAENSSILRIVHMKHDERRVSVLFSEPKIPQCRRMIAQTPHPFGFSALQRAENSSIVLSVRKSITGSVSVLFSEPKIPQCTRNWGNLRRGKVSVLFSEPKIPQL